MSFNSANVEDYIKIKNNPKLGLKYILRQRLRDQKQERKKKEIQNENASIDNDTSSQEDSDDYSVYDSDVSENEYVNVENSGIVNDDDDDTNSNATNVTNK